MKRINGIWWVGMYMFISHTNAIKFIQRYPHILERRAR